MGVSRRSVLGGALVSPLLAQTALASGAEASGVVATSEDGWLELVWTPEVQAEMDRRRSTVEAIAPAELIERDGRRGLRFPLRAAQGDPSLANTAHAQGIGTADGGFVIRNASAEMRFTQLTGDVRSEQMSARYKLNNVDSAMRPMFTWRATEGDLAVAPGAPGQPTQVRLADLPVRVAPEMAQLMETSRQEYDLPSIAADTVVAHATAQGHYLTSSS